MCCGMILFSVNYLHDYIVRAKVDMNFYVQ